MRAPLFHTPTTPAGAESVTTIFRSGFARLFRSAPGDRSEESNVESRNLWEALCVSREDSVTVSQGRRSNDEVGRPDPVTRRLKLCVYPSQHPSDLFVVGQNGELPDDSFDPSLSPASDERIFGAVDAME